MRLRPQSAKEESEKAGLKLNIQKTKIMASSPITSWQIDGEKVEADQTNAPCFARQMLTTGPSGKSLILFSKLMFLNSVWEKVGS